MEASQNKKNILIFSTAYFPFVGGAETAIKGITDHIKDYNFYMITSKMKRDLPKEERVGNVTVYRLGFGFEFDKWLLPFLGFLKAHKLQKKLKIENCKLKIILWGMMASQASITAYLFKKVYPQISYLLTLQEGDSEDYLTRGRMGLMGFFIKRMVQSADYIQVISNYLKSFAEKMGSKSTIEVVPNGVDLNKFSVRGGFTSGGKAKEQILKLQLGIKDNEKIIITVSRLVKKNGVDTIIRSLRDLSYNLKISNYKLLILGTGEEEGSLKELAKELRVESKIIWTGFVDYNYIPSYLNLADVFVRPSRSEGLGSAFLEAMASGVPIIGTKVGGIPDFLVHNETGLFVKVDDPQDLASQIKGMFTDDTLRVKIIGNGLRLVKNKYNWQSVSQQMNRIFNTLS